MSCRDGLEAVWVSAQRLSLAGQAMSSLILRATPTRWSAGLRPCPAQNWSSSIRMAEPPRSNRELHGKPPRSWTTCAPPTLLPVTTLLWSRWREIEVHHVDLDLGYTSEQWPSPLISWMLPRLLESLSDRTVPGELAAWALDRGAPPRLRAWGT